MFKQDNGQFTFARSCDPKIDMFQSCNFVGSKPTGFENLLCLVLSLTVSEIMANLRFRGHLNLRGNVTQNYIFKSCNFVVSKPTGVENKLRFVLSLTVSEMRHTGFIQNFANFQNGRQKAINIYILTIFNRLLRNVKGLIPIKFQSIISKHVASIDVTIIC